MDGLNATQRDILIIICGFRNSPYGEQIKQELEQYYETSITSVKLYGNLSTLDEDGYIHKEDRDGRSYHYSLSDKGEETLDGHFEWREEQTPDTLSPSY